MRSCDTMIERIARRADDPEGGVAMLLALMTILMVLSISIAVAGVTLSQVKPTQLNRKTVSTQNAAEAGFDVALNRIRNAASGTTKDSDGNIVPAGVRASLPCGPITGSVTGGAASDTSYSVTLAYYFTDPTGKPQAWLNSSTNKSACPIPASPAPLPNFVTLAATGSAATIPGTHVGRGNRIVQTVYALSTTNSHIVGGTIPFYDNSTFCFAVSDGANKVLLGDKIKVATCNAGSPLQNWSYTKNLQLQILATDGSLLCMQATNGWGTVVLLATCSTLDLPPASPSLPYTQIWAYNDNGQFQSSNSGETGLQNNTCLNLYAGSPSAGNPVGEALGDLVDVDKCGASILPTPSVGAGAAGTTLRRFQLVNYQNFGRCVDDLWQHVGSAWMIGYPCKQDPLATNLTWNQVFYTGISGGHKGTGSSASNGGTVGTGNPPGDTVIATPPVYNALGVQTAPGTGCQISQTTACQIISYVNKGLDGSQPDPAYWCLEAGNTTSPHAVPSNGTVPSLQPCVTSDNYQKWTYTQAYYSNYAQQYLIQPYNASANNLCLSMTIGSHPPSTPWSDPSGGGMPPTGWGYISLQTCDGKAWQKWNAPPNPQTSAQKNTFEVPNP